MDAETLRTVAVLTTSPVAVVAFLWAVYSARRSWRDAHAIRTNDFVRHYTNDFYGVAELPRIAYAIDNGRWQFGEDQLGGQEEIDLDRLLDFLNTVGLAVQQRIITLADLQQTTIGYLARRVWEDASIQWYLRHIAQHDQTTGTLAFGHFRQLGGDLAITGELAPPPGKNIP